MLVLHPSSLHVVGISALGLACLLGIIHGVFKGRDDPMHCKALLNDGSWLDSKYQNWQPEGCMLHAYREAETASCLQSKEIIFAGDSVTRKLFFEFATSLDKSLHQPTLDPTKKHSDHDLRTKHGTRLKFAWDPFLNTTYAKSLLSAGKTKPALQNNSTQAPVPSMLVLGSGLWYLRYSNTSGGLSAWESNMESIFDTLVNLPKPADEVVILPVEHVVTPKLSAERASTMHPSDIEAMNSDLFHRINPPVANHGLFGDSPPPASTIPVSLPLVFNKMLHESLTEDGLHFSDALLQVQARILLNLHCNKVMPKSFPFNKTCCNRYPSPSLPHMAALVLIFLTGPLVALLIYNSRLGGLQNVLLSPEARAPLIISLALVLIFFADRSNMWLKEQRQFDPWFFGGLCLFSLLVGLASVVRTDKDLGFLNRDQTDEWKGWMQITILIYHYSYASQISGLYNPIRILVASYLFMTGYGHTTFYVRKADYGLKRTAQVLIRLNLFTILLAYTMNTNYISYYFTPLVTMWYIVIYLTLFIAARYNNRTPLLLGKIGLSAAVMTWFFNEQWLLETLFDILHKCCGIRWSAREWAFRVKLDMWIVYVGMLASIVVMKVREHRLTDDPRWPTCVKGSIVLSAIVLIWFFAFELLQESKFAYNTWHPYVSFMPIVAFVILRNANPILRSASSRSFAFLGKCSLELFIVQFHFWLAADTKGILVVLPGINRRPLNFVITTIMFVYLCDRIAWATGHVTTRICSEEEKERELLLPTIASPSTAAHTDTVFDAGTVEDGQEITIFMKPLGPSQAEPDTPIRPRWIEHPVISHSSLQVMPSAARLRLRFAALTYTLSLHTKIFVFLFLLWTFNILWVYPPDHSS